MSRVYTSSASMQLWLHAPVEAARPTQSFWSVASFSRASRSASCCKADCFHLGEPDDQLDRCQRLLRESRSLRAQAAVCRRPG